jgi:DNA-binding CsgD family transcriptional regulator
VLGRAAELGLVEDLLAEVGRGGGSLLFAGEPGIGKSLLLDVGAQRAREAGFTVLRAAGAEFEAEVGYSGLHQLLLPLMEHVGVLSPALHHALLVALGFDTGDGAPTDRLSVGKAVSVLLGSLTAGRPLLLVVDDVQWLDRQSAAVLQFVVGYTRRGRVGLLGAARGESAAFAQAGGLRQHVLAPLAGADAGSLLDRHHPALRPVVRDRMLGEAQGNPLALLELPATLNPAQRDGQELLPAVLPLTGRLEAAFTARIRQLPVATRRVLLVAALERRLSLPEVESAARASAGWLRPAEAGGLVRADQGTGELGFRHPLIRAAVVAASTHEERRGAHRQIAVALPDQLERRAWHLAAAADGPDEVAGELMERAARAMIARGDGAGGVSALVRAAELSAGPGLRRRRLAEAAYVAAMVTGELREVSRLVRDVRRGEDDAEPNDAASLHAAAAAAYVLLVREGDVETAHRLLVAAIEHHAGSWDAGDRALIDALDTLLLVCKYYGREDAFAPFHAAVARLRPEPPAELALMSAILTDPARRAGGSLADLDQALSRLGRGDDRLRISRITSTAVHVDRGSDVREVLSAVLSESSGASLGQSLEARRMLLVDLFHAGDWDEAAVHLEAGLEICRAHEFGLMRWPFVSMQALLAAARGDGPRLQEAVRDMLGWATPRGVHSLLADTYRATALDAVGRGDFEEGYRQAGLISPPGVLASHVPHAMWVALALVESAVRTHRHDEARAHVAALQESGMAGVSSRMALLVAGCAAYTADDEQMAARFADALDAPEAARWPFDVARIRLVYGERLRRARATAPARAQLAAALATFERLGARPWAARAGAELEAAGVRIAPADGLTPQERQVAELAASGLSNREIAERLFLSPRTVGAHLYRAFPKLHVTSRAALRDALASRRSPA